MRFAGLVALALLAAAPARAAEPPAYTVTTLGETDAIVVDGRMDEEVWARAAVIDEFVGHRPEEGFAPAGETRVRVAADDRHLYFFFEARLDDDRRVRAYIAEREDINDDDQVGIALDPFGDGRRAYVLWVNALGVQQDLVWNGHFPNFAWDAVFKTKGRIVDGGYDVEIAIPFRSLRFPADEGHAWRFLVERKWPDRGEYAGWPAIERDKGPGLLQYAELRGLQPGRSGIGLELLPTVVVRAGQERDPHTGDLAWREPAFRDTVDPGFGLKWQVTPSLTLDATLNPDFSQIEADPDLIDNNLRFALSLEERRPFFLEGRELYNGFMLYSRSIVDPLYGVKFSGRQGRTSVALLHAMDESPAPSVVSERETPGFMASDIDGALALVSHAEGRWRIGKRHGFSVAYGDKEIVRDGEHVGRHHLANVGGTFWIDDVSAVDAAVAYSVTGRPGERALHAPAWYAEYARRTRLLGFGAGAAGSMPDFRTENGFFPQPGTASFWGWLHRRFELTGPVRWIALGVETNGHLEELDEDQPVPGAFEIEGGVELRLPGVTDIEVQAGHWDARYLGKDFQGLQVEVEISTNPLGWLAAELEGSFGDTIRFEDATPTIQRQLLGEISLRGLRRLHLDLSGGYNFVGRPGEPIDRLIIYRAKTVVGFTRALSLRVIVQGRNGSTVLDGDVLDAWSRLDFTALVTLNPSPGTSIHVGFGERWEWGRGGKPETQTRDLFAKGSLLIRL